MDDEKLQILKMLEEKKITADEALKLLEAIENSKVDSQEAKTSSRGKILRIKVKDGSENVNINVPLGLAGIAKKFVPFDISDKLDEISKAAEEGRLGKIVEVKDGDEEVEIYID